MSWLTNLMGGGSPLGLMKGMITDKNVAGMLAMIIDGVKQREKLIGGKLIASAETVGNDICLRLYKRTEDGKTEPIGVYYASQLTTEDVLKMMDNGNGSE